MAENTDRVGNDTDRSGDEMGQQTLTEVRTTLSRALFLTGKRKKIGLRPLRQLGLAGRAADQSGINWALPGHGICHEYLTP